MSSASVLQRGMEQNEEQEEAIKKLIEHFQQINSKYPQRSEQWRERLDIVLKIKHSSPCMHLFVDNSF